MRWCAVIVDVRFSGMVFGLVDVLVVVAVSQHHVVMFVRVPGRTVLELTEHFTKAAAVVVGHVVMVMIVNNRRVGMGRLAPLAFDGLLRLPRCHGITSCTGRDRTRPERG
jgi:hypothetical protein